GHMLHTRGDPPPRVRRDRREQAVSRQRARWGDAVLRHARSPSTPRALRGCRRGTLWLLTSPVRDTSRDENRPPAASAGRRERAWGDADRPARPGPTRAAGVTPTARRRVVGPVPGDS